MPIRAFHGTNNEKKSWVNGNTKKLNASSFVSTRIIYHETWDPHCWLPIVGCSFQLKDMSGCSFAGQTNDAILEGCFGESVCVWGGGLVEHKKCSATTFDLAGTNHRSEEICVPVNRCEISCILIGSDDNSCLSWDKRRKTILCVNENAKKLNASSFVSNADNIS